ncbi:MAG TPA: Gfo/Idh/MocA family oxidoreductase [Pyrinomonadaceae bacterium]|nr:Gfo/Idh/MocA family oxidoreductase [Pyrinomonadaceae bacterium]
MANDMIGVGIIGAGFARTTQIPAFRACEGARVVAIASGHRENAERVAREFEIPFVGEWREVVAREDVDLVCVTTPPSTHAEMTLAALDAGKAVLCEKPTAMNFEEAARMRRRAEESGLVAHIDHELRFLPARLLMRETIASGRLGRVWHAKVNFRADSRATDARGWDWWSDAEQGGGVLGALGSHAVDSLHTLLSTRTREVSCTLATHVRERAGDDGAPRPVTSDDEANLLLNFYDSDACEGATGAVSLSVVEAGVGEHTVEVFGSRGAMRTDATGALFEAKVGGKVWERVDTEEAPLAEGMQDNEWSRGFTVFARALVEEVRKGGRRGGVRGAATFEDGYHVQRVLDAARASHESGCRATVGD